MTKRRYSQSGALTGLLGLTSGIQPVTFFLHCQNGQIHVQMETARWTTDDVAQRLNTDNDGISYLVKEKLLRPLGEPIGNKAKYFHVDKILVLMRDEKWLNKVTDALYRFNEERNSGAQQRRLLAKAGVAEVSAAAKKSGRNKPK